MISLLKKAGGYIWGFMTGKSEIESTIDIDFITASIDASEAVDTSKSKETAPYSTNSGDRCQHRVGTVTSLYTDYGLIDGTLYFDLRDSPAEILCVGDHVSYIAFRRQENEEWRVRRIYCILDENWEKCSTDHDDYEEEEELQVEDSVMQSKEVMKRNVVCQVTMREEREVTLMPGNIHCSLDEVSAEFIPLEGDWVVINAVVEVNEDVCDLSGEVLDVEEIRPLRSRLVTGCVTHWNKNSGGVVDQYVYFTQDSCEPGYIPHLGDKVVVEAIETEHGQYTWRALKTVPTFLLATKRKAGDELNDSADIYDKLENLLAEKKGIVITKCLNFGILNVGEERELVAEVKNTGLHNQHFIQGRFHSRLSESQFCLHHPSDGQLSVLHPGQTVEFCFGCKGRFIGNSSELFVFTFKGFKIGRNLQVEVQDPLNSSLAPSPNKKSVNHHEAWQRTFQTRNSRMLVPGVRPIKPPAFVPVRLGIFPVPNRLLEAVVGNDERRNIEDVEDAVYNIAPCLSKNLTMLNYSDRFHMLLYLEEIQGILGMQKYDLERVCFRIAGPSGEFLALEVPGLAEKRPSLVLGDRAIASDPAPQGSTGFQFEGFIHKVFRTEVWLKFTSNFHASYNRSEYNVSFHFSRIPVRRCHAAVNLAPKHLGPQILFPTSLKVQPPQLHYEEEELSFTADGHVSLEDTKNYIAADQSSGSICSDGGKTLPKPSDVKCLCHLKVSSNGNHRSGDSQVPSCLSDISFECHTHTSCVSTKIPEDTQCKNLKQYVKNEENAKHRLVKGSLLNVARARCQQKRKLIWFNSQLNFCQKEAVRNILKGEARPLPYVIFGPPGTGKTVTLVEAVLQIFDFLPDSRLLVATPSNSSADLVAERLLDSGHLKPGDLVRLVGYNRIEEGIPEKLVPYCTAADIRLPTGDASKPAAVDGPMKASSSAQTLGRHRITVGTCIALGQLYSMGFTQGHFTHVFVDEAGQATEPEILVPLGFIHTSSGQVILAGDPLQLGPVILSRLASQMGLDESFLSRLLQRPLYQRDSQGFPHTGGYNPRLVTRLALNYRSVPEILNLPSSLFYNSSLESQVSQTTGPEASVLASLASELPKRSIEDGPPALVFHGIRGENYQEEESPSWYNPQEIVQSICYLNVLYSMGLNSSDVGIITPYQKQVQKLRSLIEEFDVPIPKIGSVEEFQGQERMVIIMSAVRSSPTLLEMDIRHALGFITSPKRLNVSLTRARALLIILGNPHVLAKDPCWREVLEYCVKRGGYIGCDLPTAYSSLTLDDSE